MSNYFPTATKTKAEGGTGIKCDGCDSFVTRGDYYWFIQFEEQGNKSICMKCGGRWQRSAQNAARNLFMGTKK